MFLLACIIFTINNSSKSYAFRLKLILVNIVLRTCDKNLIILERASRQFQIILTISLLENRNQVFARLTTVEGDLRSAFLARRFITPTVRRQMQQTEKKVG